MQHLCGIVAADTILVGIHLRHIFGLVQIALQRGQRFVQPTAAPVNELCRHRAVLRVSEPVEDLRSARVKGQIGRRLSRRADLAGYFWTGFLAGALVLGAATRLVWEPSACFFTSLAFCLMRSRLACPWRPGAAQNTRPRPRQARMDDKAALFIRSLDDELRPTVVPGDSPRKRIQDRSARGGRPRDFNPASDLGTPSGRRPRVHSVCRVMGD